MKDAERLLSYLWQKSLIVEVENKVQLNGNKELVFSKLSLFTWFKVGSHYVLSMVANVEVFCAAKVMLLYLGSSLRKGFHP